jgi:type IV secretory pathway VirJ component
MTLIKFALLALILLAAAPGASAQALPRLPKDTLVEYQVAGSGGDLVVILSGDGGWADLDRQLGNRMVARGLSVLGFDCMKYFWETRSPEQTARDLNAVLEHYLTAWGKQRLVLIGYSFGAAVEPFVLARMSDALRAKVALAVLLGPGTYANWEIHWGDWLRDQPHDSARPVAPELANVKGLRTLCVWGAEEAEGSLCPALPKGTAELLELPGGHHFDEDYTKLADLILQRVR